MGFGSAERNKKCILYKMLLQNLDDFLITIIKAVGIFFCKLTSIKMTITILDSHTKHRKSQNTIT